MSYKSSKRLGYITPAQRSFLVDLVTADKQLIKGKFTNDFTFQHARQRWEDIAKECNAIPGCRKDWKHWRKTWQDIRWKTKSKAAAIRKHASGIGELPTIKLTHEESSDLNVISPIPVLGHTELTESEAEFDNISIEYVEQTQSSNIHPVVEENMVKQEISSAPKKKLKGIIAQRRLQSGWAAIELLASQKKKKTEMKEEMNQFLKDYYNKKLAILKEKSDAMKSIALSMKKISNKM